SSSAARDSAANEQTSATAPATAKWRYFMDLTFFIECLADLGGRNCPRSEGGRRRASVMTLASDQREISAAYPRLRTPYSFGNTMWAGWGSRRQIGPSGNPRAVLRRRASAPCVF